MTFRRVYGFVPHRCDAADCCSAAVGTLLVALAVAHAWTDLTYDEAVYLRLARTISETGLPLRRSYGDFSSFELFRNSPPLVLYTAAATQLVAPGLEVPARGFYLAVFIFPTYALAWFLARRNFGSWCGFRRTLRLPHKRWLPRRLAAMCCWTSRWACGPVSVSRVSSRRRDWDATRASRRSSPQPLSSWRYGPVTKLFAWSRRSSWYGAWALFSSRRRDPFSVVVPLAAVLVTAAGALAALLAFFFVFGGDDALAQTLRLNLQRSALPVMLHSLTSPEAWERRRGIRSQLGSGIAAGGHGPVSNGAANLLLHRRLLRRHDDRLQSRPFSLAWRGHLLSRFGCPGTGHHLRGWGRGAGACPR